MDSLISSADYELVKNFLGKAAQASLTNYLIIVWVVWQVMGKKVSAHFANVEHSISKIAFEMTELKTAVMADLAIQSRRMAEIESNVIILKNRVERLEDH